MVSGYLEINIDLSAFKEGNKTMNVVELMDIFWKILDQNAEVKDSGRVPLEGDPVMAWWRIKPYLNTDTFAGGGSNGGKDEYNVYEDKEGHSCDTPVKKVNRYSRAKKSGTVLRCPKCDSTEGNRVYHFSWSAITCQNCREMVEKNEWEIDEES